jgi:hypothetical protein
MNHQHLSDVQTHILVQKLSIRLHFTLETTFHFILRLIIIFWAHGLTNFAQGSPQIGGHGMKWVSFKFVGTY